MFHAPYRWSYPRVWFTNVRYILNQLISGIKNVVRWAPVIWDDQDYDWDALASIMEYKLRRMSLHFKHNKYVTGADRVERETLMCAELLHRLRDDSYYFDSAQKTMGRDTQFNGRHLWVKRHDQLRKQDSEYLFKLINRKMRTWWD